MNDEHYDDVYGLDRPPEKIIQDMAKKANPHTPPWLLEKTDDLQILDERVLYAFDTGELVWTKNPNERKSHLGQEKKRNWRDIGRRWRGPRTTRPGRTCTS